MTKKHFDALAAALKEARLAFALPIGVETAETQSHRDILMVASVCARFNPNFDRARFLTACGVEAK